MDKVLVLDCSYMPINVINWKKAISYVLQEKVEVLGEYDRIIKSASSNWKIPAIIRFIHKFPNFKKIVKFNRKNVYARDQYKCQYCGQRFDASKLTYDHVIPRSRGGLTNWENIVTACFQCNINKADKSPHEAGMKLNKSPVKPSWLYVLSNKLIDVDNLPLQWQYFFHTKKR